MARLKLGSSSPVEPLPRNDTAYQVGREEQFTVIDLPAKRPFMVTAVLRYVTPSAYFYIQKGQPFSSSELERSAIELEQRIVPAVHRYVNPGWEPGASIDSRITILHAIIPGVAGYYNSSDEFPAAANRLSNQRPMVYMNLASVRPGTERYFAVLAHELQHAAHSQADRAEETWVQEGASELLADLLGYPVALYLAFLQQPDTQLTAWADSLSRTAPHYGASHLFLKYIGAQLGYDTLPRLITDTLTGIAGIEAFLESQGFQGGLEAAFKEWVVANYAIAPPGGPFSYPGVGFQAALSGSVGRPGAYAGEVHQYAADYIELRPDRELLLTFRGPTTANLISTAPPSGAFLWWSNRGDSIDTTLTRRFDLSQVAQATLKFKLWFDIEEHFDHAYVEASRDGGNSWEVLRGQHTTGRDPLGLSFGHGYTSKSGGGTEPVWVEESIDLSPYAGGVVLVRFEYVTDEGSNNEGLAIDDIMIPEIGFFDDAEVEAGWEAGGFFRTNNLVRQRFLVLIILAGEEPQVAEMPLDSGNRGWMALGAGERAVLVVAALAPVTTQAAAYSYTLMEPEPPDLGDPLQVP